MDNFWLFVGIFVIVDLAILTLVIVSRGSRRFSSVEKERYRQLWEKIKVMEIRHAVMEADKLLDRILERCGYRGTLGDKLKKAGPAFTNVNDVWSAHKLRNRLAHELGVTLAQDEARAALRKFERAYKDLGMF